MIPKDSFLTSFRSETHESWLLLSLEVSVVCNWMLLKMVEHRWDFIEDSRISQAMFLITNMRCGRHVNARKAE